MRADADSAARPKHLTLKAGLDGSDLQAVASGGASGVIALAVGDNVAGR